MSGEGKVNLSDPDFKGYLTKQSAWLKEWRKRYFVLKENQLHFMKTPTAEPHGTIDLKEVRTANCFMSVRLVSAAPLCL